MQLQRITRHTKPTDRTEKWHLIDADGERIGRLATKVASILQGKNRADKREDLRKRDTDLQMRNAMMRQVKGR